MEKSENEIKWISMGNNNQVVWKFALYDREYFTIESMELDGSLHTL